MTNEEFQLLVLQELKELKEGQKTTNERLDNLEAGQKALEAGQNSLREEMNKGFHEIMTQTIEIADYLRNKMATTEDLEVAIETLGGHVVKQEFELNKVKRVI